jgi:hypothetical protein
MISIPSGSAPLRPDGFGWIEQHEHAMIVGAQGMAAVASWALCHGRSSPDPKRTPRRPQSNSDDGLEANAAVTA